MIVADYSTTRRRLIEWGFMTRADGVYLFTELGEAAWRIEHFVMDNYLMPAARSA